MASLQLGFVLIVFALLLGGVEQGAFGVSLPPLVPWPRDVGVCSESSSLPVEFAIRPEGQSIGAANRVAEVFADDLREMGFDPRITQTPAGVEPVVSLALGRDASLGDEGYRLIVNEGISISAYTERGLFWGTRTLLQLLTDGPRSRIPKLAISDRPEYGFRGAHVDVARQFHSIDFHMRMIKNLAKYKINVYHIHFSDDQSYTLPSGAFPNLPTPDRHYTKEQLKELAKLAARYHVTIVPEIEMPGHNSYLGQHLKDVVCQGKEWSWMTCAGSEKSYSALEKLISETMEIFPGPYFHIGADEVDIGSWRGCPDCEAVIAREGLEDHEALYHYFINRMNRFVRSKGRTTIIWEGFKVGKEPIVDKDVLVEMFDNRYSSPADLVDKGYNIINTSWVPLYVVRHMASTPEALAEWNALYFGGGHPPRPLSELIKIEPTERLKGVTMCSWENPEEAQEGFFFGTGKRMEGYAEPARRLPIVAERAWSGSRTSAEDVLSRVSELR